MHDRGLVSRIYIFFYLFKFLQFNNRKTTQFFKWTRDFTKTLRKADIQLAKRHMRGCPKFSEIQIRSTMRYSYARTGRARASKIGHLSAGEDAEKLGLRYAAWGTFDGSSILEK